MGRGPRCPVRALRLDEEVREHGIVVPQGAAVEQILDLGSLWPKARMLNAAHIDTTSCQADIKGPLSKEIGAPRAPPRRWRGTTLQPAGRHSAFRIFTTTV